jgi:hypothetical protein
MFKILGQDGKEYGPVGADVVQRWIAEGRATAQTRVQAEGSPEWKSLGECPEFREALSRGASPPALPPRPLSVSPMPAGEQKSLAIVSLVLGLLSLCGGLLTGIPAAITGAIAYSRARRDPARYGGSGMALAGLILGCCSLFFTAILAGMLLPALAKAKYRAQTINCVSNLKQVGLAALMYANDNKGVLPRDFASMSNELSSPTVLICPSDSSRQHAVNWTQFSPANVSYEFLTPGAKADDVVRQQVFRCPIHNNVGYGDGSVQQMGGRQNWQAPRRR